MEIYKVVVVTLMYCFICAATCTTTEKLQTQKLQPRIDSYDNILRPPPPPPSSVVQNVRVQYTINHQRPQRQNTQFRQPFALRQPSLHANQEVYPPLIPFRPTQPPSFFQKVSSWFFPSENKQTYAAPPPIYGVPAPTYGAPPPTYGAPPVKDPEPTYGAPPSRPPPLKLQQGPQTHSKKKDCNLCNYFPWVPVLRYQTGPKSNELNKHTAPSAPNNAYLPPGNDLSGPLTTAIEKPFSSLNTLPISSESNIPKSTLTNSYGNPVVFSTYGPPLPITNDESPGYFNQKPFNYNNYIGDEARDTIENLETNHVPQLTKPNGEIVFNESHNNIRLREKPILPSGFSEQHKFNEGRGVHVLQPIPFPNLNPFPMPPIFNARPFKKINKYKENSGIPTNTRHPSHGEHGIFSSSDLPNNSNFQLVPSVPLAEFTSSIEYPINIIQSPLLEIDASKDKHRQNNVNLHKHPIIVENEAGVQDSFSAASGDSEGDHESHSSNKVNNEYHFAPTPLPPIDDEKFPPAISYSFIDQTFSSQKNSISTSTPSNIDLESITNLFEHSTIDVKNNFKDTLQDTLQSLDSPLLYLKPSAPHKEPKAFRIPPIVYNSTKNENKIVSQYEKLPTTTPQTIKETRPTSASSNVYRYLENESVTGRWPPPTDVTENNPTKKAKRIQIIIPYTSNNQPSPFRFSNNDIGSPSGWIPVIRDVENYFGRKIPVSEHSTVNDLHTTNSLLDYHESSESKIVASSAPSLNFTASKYNDSGVNNLLNQTKPTFDIKKLQQNIDEWTAQEYSKIYKRQQKSSTTSHLKRSKKIPDEYLTTTPSHKKTTRTFFSKINELNTSLLDNEAAGSIQQHTNLQNKSLNLKTENHLRLETTTFGATKAHYITRKTPKLEKSIETTTLEPKTTTRHSWERVPTSISPLTKEKVYVVTPQPWYVVNASYSFKNKERINEVDPGSRNLSFKSPRFINRPTPGPTGSQKDLYNLNEVSNNSWKASFNWLQSINNLEESTTELLKNKSKSEAHAVTTHTPIYGSTVHTISGHSKVVTVVTQTSTPKTARVNYS